MTMENYFYYKLYLTNSKCQSSSKQSFPKADKEKEEGENPLRALSSDNQRSKGLSEIMICHLYDPYQKIKKQPNTQI